MNRPTVSRRGVLRSLGTGLVAGSAGCTGVLSSSELKPLPTLKAVTVSSYDPETKHLHVTITRGETVTYETTLTVDGFDRKQNRELGTAMISPSEIDQKPARWAVTASLDPTYSETVRLADEVDGGQQCAVLIRIGDHESMPDAKDFALTVWSNGEDPLPPINTTPHD